MRKHQSFSAKSSYSLWHHLLETPTRELFAYNSVSHGSIA